MWGFLMPLKDASTYKKYNSKSLKKNSIQFIEVIIIKEKLSLS